MSEFTVANIPPEHVDRVIDLEKQELERIGLSLPEIDACVPNANILGYDMMKRPGAYLGMYTASRLIGFSMIDTWTPSDDIPFTENAFHRGLLRIATLAGRSIVPSPMGLSRLTVDQGLSDVYAYRATHGLIHAITRIAESSEQMIHAVVVDPEKSPLTKPLLEAGFQDSGLRIRNEEGVERSAKYTRPLKKPSRGHKMPSLSRGLRLAHES
jgi:hypothetical protein